MMRLAIAIIVCGVLLVAAESVVGQAPAAAFPRIVEHAHAAYPAAALDAQVQGDVMVKFTTDGRVVVTAEAASGPAELQQTCVDNVKTWKFAHHTPGTFQAIFRFRILVPGHAFEDVFPGPPNFVEVIAAPSAGGATQ
jgi:hypothetical protein